MKECDLCGKKVEKYHRRYKGKGYCSTCYAYLFKKKSCFQCGVDKRIYRYLTPPVCQQCELKDQPCIRCRKIKYSIGKITENGPVCNSCSKYYRPKQTCSICSKAAYNVSRRLKYGELEPICDKCFNKKHFVSCYRCRQRVAPFFFDFDHHAYCMPCATKPDKNCLVCSISMPAGHHSNTCKDCHAKARIEKTLKENKTKLFETVFEIYDQYTAWLLRKKDSPSTSRQIIKDLEIFEFLNQWLVTHHKPPSYEQYATALTVRKTRSHLLATTFLNECGYFIVSDKIKSKAGDLNTIDRLLEKIPLGSALRCFVEGYYEEMLRRFTDGTISSRSFRLAMTPAVAMLGLGLQQEKILPDNELIKQYLWLHHGQRAAITGFINFLKHMQQVDISMPSENHFRFTKPAESRARLKQKIIGLLRSNKHDQNMYVKTAIEYFHNIQFPNELKMINSLPVTIDNTWIALSLAGVTVSIPKHGNIKLARF